MVLKNILDKGLERRFREVAMKKYGFSRGAIKQASMDAFRRWLNEEDSNFVSKEKDIFKLIEGKMKHLRGKYTSVQLQHEAVKLWAKEK